jgi:hypothetical protein
MNILGYIIFNSWIPLVVVVFAAFPAKRAVVFATLSAQLILPVASFNVPGLPDYTKTVATTIGLVIGGLIFGRAQLFQLKLHWCDFPMVVWCLVSIPTSLLNGLGLYDGISGTSNAIITWGLPYMLGRAFLGSADGQKELTRGILVGALLYMPLCLWEIRVSPQLHRVVYGFAQRDDFLTTIRYGGYRPIVFTFSGLELGLFMAAASLIGCWLWAAGLKRLRKLPFGTMLLPALLVTTVLCKSSGALVEMVVGLFVLWAAWRMRSRLLVWALLFVAPLYCATRATGIWNGGIVVESASSWFGADRAQSLEFRLVNEDMLIAKAKQQVIFGWGGWGRARVHDEESGRDLTITDGLWIIAFGNHGIVGLLAILGAILGPAAAWVSRNPSRTWRDPDVAPGAALAVLLGIYMIDNLSNAMFNPIYLLAAGAVAASNTARERSRSSDQNDNDEAGHGDPTLDVLERASALALDCEAIAESSADPQAMAAWNEAERTWRDVVASVGDLPADSPRTKASLANAYEHIGRCATRCGRWSAAIEAGEHAVRLRTALQSEEALDEKAVLRLADALNDLAWLLVSAANPSARDVLKGRQLADRAVRMFPESAPYQNTVAAAMCRMGEWTAAIGRLNRSIALGRGGTAVDYLLLSIAHARLSDGATARSMLAQADALMSIQLQPAPSFAVLRNEAIALLSQST